MSKHANAPMKNTKSEIANPEQHEKQQSIKQAKKNAKILKRQRQAAKVHKLEIEKEL